MYNPEIKERCLKCGNLFPLLKVCNKCEQAPLPEVKKCKECGGKYLLFGDYCSDVCRRKSREDKSVPLPYDDPLDEDKLLEVFEELDALEEEVKIEEETGYSQTKFCKCGRTMICGRCYKCDKPKDQNQDYDMESCR